MNSALHTLTVAWPWTTLDVLNHLWQSTAVALVVLAVLAVGRGLSARTRRTLAWMALVKFVLPTGFLAHALTFSASAPDRGAATTALIQPIVLPAFMASATEPMMPAPDRVSVGLMFAGVWFAGFAGLLLSWLVRGRTLRGQIVAETQPVSAALGARITAAAGRAGLRAAPRCWSVGSERAPGVLGVLAPVVILPRGLEATLTPAELDAVLLHEFIHVRRRDNLWTAGQAVFGCLLWFHPVVWLLNRRLALETEQSCDEGVLEITGDADTYAGGIVKAVQHALGLAQPGLIGATTPPIITRIKNILAHGSRRDRPLARGGVLAGGVLVVALSGYAGSFAAPAEVAEAGGAAVEPVAATPVPVAVAAPVAKAEPTLSVDFPDEDIRRILRNVAELFQLNVVFPVELRGRASVKLQDATWQQIFQVTLASVDYTFVEEGKLVKVVPVESSKAGTNPTEAPVAMSSLPALAAQARLVDQADLLKREAEALQREAEAYAAAKTNRPEAAADPEAAAKAASLAALDARQQALETAVVATGETARMAELEEKRQAEARVLRARMAEDRARRQALSAAAASDAGPAANDPKLPAPTTARSAPTAPIGSALAESLVGMAQARADEYRASGVRVYEPRELDYQPVPAYQARPLYPFALRRSNVSGEATIDFVVDENGSVVAAHAIAATHVEFAEAATAAVAKWKFKAGRRSGHNVPVHMQVPARFTLSGQ